MAGTFELLQLLIILSDYANGRQSHRQLRPAALQLELGDLCCPIKLSQHLCMFKLLALLSRRSQRAAEDIHPHTLFLEVEEVLCIYYPL
jgi:hypothetical protein